MKYSITIPAYKAQFFEDCLDSVLSQTFNDYEVIVLNDCSPEDIRGIVQRHKCPQLRYYENESNVGAVHVVDNWNKLLGLARGEFIICMGDDDKLTPNYLTALNRLMEQWPGLDVYHVRAMIIDGDSKMITLQDDRPDWESAYSFMWHRDRKCSYIGDFCLRTATLKSLGGYVKFPLALASDNATVEMVGKRNGIATTHHPDFLYRSTKATITTSGDAKMEFEASHQVQQWQKDFLAEEPSDKMDEIYRQHLLDNIDDFFIRSRTEYITVDLSRHFISGIFHWLPKLRKEHIPFSYFMFACIKSLYYKHKGYYN